MTTRKKFGFDSYDIRRLKQLGLTAATIEKLRHACLLAVAQGWFDTKPPDKNRILDSLKSIREHAKLLKKALTSPPAAVRSDFYDFGIRVQDLTETLDKVVAISDQLLIENASHKATSKAFSCVNAS